MYLQRQKTFTCGSCSKTFETVCANTQYTLPLKDMRRAVSDGMFFSTPCLHCGEAVFAPQAFFYRNEEYRCAIRMDPDETRAEVFYSDAVAYSRQGYSLRLVSTPDAFVEKILLLEYGYQDKVIELWKSMHFARVTRPFEGRAIDALLFAERAAGKYVSFKIMSNTQSLSTIVFLKREYDMYLAKLHPYLRDKEKRGRYMRVDAQWVESAEGHYLMRKLHAAQELRQPQHKP